MLAAIGCGPEAETQPAIEEANSEIPADELRISTITSEADSSSWSCHVS